MKSLFRTRRGMAWWWKPGLFGIIALVAIGFFLWRSSSSLGGYISRSTGPSTVRAETGTELAAVTRGDIKRTLLLDGELRAVRSRSIFARSGQEAKITYLPPEGSAVKAGDRLVELESGTFLDKIKEVEEQIVAAENEITKTRFAQEAALHEMNVQLSRLWLIYEQAAIKARIPVDVIPRREYQDNQLAFERARAEHENQLDKIEKKKKEQAAELQVKIVEKQKLEVQLEQARSDLQGMILTAPADGMVIYSDHWAERRKIQVGDVVWGGFPLVILPDLTEMEVLAQVNEVDGPLLAIDQRAEVVLDSFPDVRISGTVKEIAQTAVKASWREKAKVFRVVISLDRTVTEIMKPGMSARISVVVAENRSQLLVPRSAVRFETDGPTVMKVGAENRRRPVVVTVLHSDPFYYAVAENGDVKEGDQIVSGWGR